MSCASKYCINFRCVLHKDYHIDRHRPWANTLPMLRIIFSEFRGTFSFSVSWNLIACAALQVKEDLLLKYSIP